MIAAWALAAAVAVLPSGAEFTLEIAADAESRARGYMFRESVGPREGMWFVFEAAGRHGIWMKNCRVSLDLVWLDGSRRVAVATAIGTPYDAPPCASAVRARSSAEIASGAAASRIACALVRTVAPDRRTVTLASSRRRRSVPSGASTPSR